MSFHEYHMSKIVAAEDYPFYALIMAAYRAADTFNAATLRAAFPSLCAEFEARYHAPGGLLDQDRL